MSFVSLPVWVFKQAVSHPMATVVGYAGLTGFAIGYAPTRQLGWRMGSFGIRAAGNITWGAARGLSTTTLVRGGSMTFGGGIVRATGAVAAGYLLGAVVGTVIARQFWGVEGAHDAFALYTGQVSRQDYTSVVSAGISTLFD